MSSRSHSLEMIECRTCLPGRIDSPVRLRLLARSGLLDEPNERLDRLTDLAARLLSVPIVAVSLVDIDRQVFTSQVGVGEPHFKGTPLRLSFCQYVVTDGKPLIIEDANRDERLCTNPAIEQLGVVAYAGFPIVCQEQVMGSFCAIKPSPHTWEPLELEVLAQFAETVSDLIDLRLEYEELRSTERNLLQANEELETMASVLAHDLKTPLRSIRSMLYLIQETDSDLSSNTSEMMGEVDGATSRLMELIDALGEFGNALQTSSEPAVVDLNLLFEDVVKDLAHEIEKTGAEVERADDLGEAFGSRPLFRQLFQNLIANALKFQPPGQLPVVRVGRDVAASVFYVQDNGVGIRQQALESIFTLYRRGDSGQKYAGMGIGLAVCARIVSKHNGRIWVDSELGQGSRFQFTLKDPHNGL